MDCRHKNLKACEPVITGIDVNMKFIEEQHPTSNICEMFTFRHYQCVDCGRIVLVLNAVVEDNKKGDK